MVKKILLIAIAAVMMLIPLSYSFAELTAAGPADPVNGFPAFYQDANGVALQIGLDPLFSFFDPPVAGNNFSQQIGFGAEAFWYLAETTVDMPVSLALPVGGKALIVMAVEAAFATGDPVNGQQFPFNRLRIRIDAPLAGTYTVTHPYGVDQFVVDVPGIGAINQTIDIGGVMPDAATALGGRIGPFLRAVNPAPPAGFIGNINILQTVTGSPFGTNFFRVRGPGGIDVQTDLFAVSGKIFTGTVGAPLTVERATYARTDHNAVDVIAASAPTAQVSVAGLTALPAAMAGDGSGKFYRHIHNGGAVLPATITVTAVNPTNTNTTLIKQLVDAVQITRAEYDANARTLTIQAASADLIEPPVLTATGFGALAAGELIVSNLLVPPASVTVTSSKGGSDTRTIDIVEIAPPPANAAPAAANDTIDTILNTAVNINVLANDTDIDGTIDPASLVITAAPLSGTAVKNLDNTVAYTPAVGFIGADAFSYTVADNLGAVSNPAAVTVNVTSATPAPNAPPVANSDVITTNAGIETTFNLLANDTDVGGAINPASVSVVTVPASGVLVNNLDGTVDYAPNPGFIGTDTFTYNVRDNLGALSNTATVIVTVNPVELLNITRAQFRRTGAAWILRATDSLGNPAISITFRLNRTGQVIGSANVDALGNVSIVLRNSPVVAQNGDTISAVSSNGATVASFNVTVLR